MFSLKPVVLKKVIKFRYPAINNEAELYSPASHSVKIIFHLSRSFFYPPYSSYDLCSYSYSDSTPGQGLCFYPDIKELSDNFQISY